MFNIEEWAATAWMVVRQNVPEHEREGLLAGNLADGNIYSDTDPTEPPPAGVTVFRFVDIA